MSRTMILLFSGSDTAIHQGAAPDAGEI